MIKQFNTAIILAGGKSSRMGFDKINIPYKNERLLDFQIKELKKIFSEIIVVSNNLSHYDDESVIVVKDEFKELGPLAGLHVGLKHASSLFNYVIACDMPFISIEFIKEMMKLLVESNKEVLVTRLNGYIEPFNAFYQRSLYQKIEIIASKGEVYGLNKLIHQTDYDVVDSKIVESYSPQMFSNLNTIEDINNYIGSDESGKNNSRD